LEDFSVATIARNEEKTIPRLLESVKGVEDIVIVDTGSTDSTVKVAKELGSRVVEVGDMFIEIPTKTDVKLFKNRYNIEPSFTTESKLFNYGAARNYAMSLAENDFSFMPDSDEVVEWNIDKVRALLPLADQIAYRFAFSHHSDGSPQLEFTHCKFFRRSKARWVKKVHEVVAPLDNPTVENLARRVYTPDMYLHHWQVPNDNRSNMLPKLEYSILEKDNDDRNTYYLAREYYYHHRWEEAIKMFTSYLKLPGWKPERSQAYIFMGDCYKYSGRGKESIECYHNALIEDDSRREPFWSLGHALYERNNLRGAVAYWVAALEVPYNPNYYLNNMELYTWKIHDQLSLVYDKLGEDKKAQEQWLEAVKASPNDERILQNSKWFNRKR
jgi:glycosyltransferase involved in cell wall biosynthesis